MLVTCGRALGFGLGFTSWQFAREAEKRESEREREREREREM